MQYRVTRNRRGTSSACAYWGRSLGRSLRWAAAVPLAVLLAGAATGDQKGSQARNGAAGEVVYSRFLVSCRGAMGAQDVAVDTHGNAYVSGHGPGDCDRGGTDPLVVAVGPAGSDLFSYIRIGGHHRDAAKAVAVDAEGNVYLAGATRWTCCRPFPLVDPFQPNPGGGRDAFVMKLDPTGTILYSTFLGGSGDDYATDVAVDAAGRILVLGSTGSANFPAAAAGTWQGPGGGEDAFLAVLDPTGQTLVHSAFLGGSGNDRGVRMELAGGRVFVAGNTSSPDFPVRGSGRREPVQGVYGGGASDAFLARYSEGGELEYATFLGGSGSDAALALATLRGRDVYLTGHTDSADFPLEKPLQEELSWPPDPDAFVVRLTRGGEGVRYSTYLATDAPASCEATVTATPVSCGGIDVDRSGAAYVTANGTVVTKISPSGGRRVYTFHGFGGNALELGPDGAVHVAGIAAFGHNAGYPLVGDHWRYWDPSYANGWVLKRTDGVNPRAELQEDDPRVTVSGHWELERSPSHSGGAALRSDEPGATLQITFTGPSIRIYGRRGPEGGILRLRWTFPSTLPLYASVDTYSTVPEDRSLLYAHDGLSGQAEYTLTLVVDGSAGPRAQGASVWFDGFDLQGQ